VYFDARAFLKLVVEEPGTDLAVALWDGCDAQDGLAHAEESWDAFWGATVELRRVSLSRPVNSSKTMRCGAPMPCMSPAHWRCLTGPSSSPSGTGGFLPALLRPAFGVAPVTLDGP